MSKYVPKFYEDDRDLLILDNLFAVEDCVDYASRHNLNVLLTVTTSASSVEAMMQFKKQGYNIELIEKEMRAPDGTKISPDIYALFTRDGNVSKTKEEENVISSEERKNALTEEEIDCFNEYLESEKVDVAFGNSDWWAIYHKIVGDKISNYARNRKEKYM